ncbi:hypothetical protein [uncultured Winogradskyella sp.]|uniref:hypothetical protein n=1 Tax=uncultured Winogradskyella sp. TaxID=395353 RepID=UPI0026166028|nr:hypothetical protein [uncultured Winogradskyella sp.]
MVDFKNIGNNTIDLADFKMKWRFTDSNYNLLPNVHLEQLKPLNKNASNFLWHHIQSVQLHSDFPFKKGFFKTIDKVKILEDNETIIKKWLFHRGLSFQKKVYLSWQPDEAMVVPWKILIKYFDDFFYDGSDDLTVIDESLNWALLFYHESEIYFGTNEKYISSNSLDSIINNDSLF